jgi:Tfp pilus assembly protein PilV
MNRRHSILPGFVLLEALLAVAIFALGVLALGRCVSNCVAAEHAIMEDAQVRRLLVNRIAEIEAGVVAPTDVKTEELAEPLRGLTLTQSSVPLAKKNETGQDLLGLVAVTLTASWRSDGENHVREQTFYAYLRTP